MFRIHEWLVETKRKTPSDSRKIIIHELYGLFSQHISFAGHLIDDCSKGRKKKRQSDGRRNGIEEEIFEHKVSFTHRATFFLHFNTVADAF